VLYLTSIFIINPVLDVWYFIMSTTLISLKLFFTYMAAHNKNPGYLEPALDFTTSILRDVPQEFICPKCKVIRTDTTVHCPVADRCIDRYDQFSRFANAPVGRGNHGFYFAFIFFFWLDVFLVGWIDVESVKVTECDLPDGQTCPLDFLCLGGLCHSLALHYLSTVVGAVICIYFFFPSQVLCCRHSYYFGINQTTFQRRPKLRYQDMAFADSYSRPKKASKSCLSRCCSNYRTMTCRRKVQDQQTLYAALIEKTKLSGCPVKHGQ